MDPWHPNLWTDAVLQWLRRRGSNAVCSRTFRDPRRLTAYLGAAGACGLLIRFLRRKNAELARVLNVPLSRLLAQIEQKEVAAAVIGSHLCAFRTHDGGVCRASLLPQDTKLVTKLLHKNGVEFRAQGQPGWRTAVVLLVPFVYLGLCSWLLWKMTADTGFSGGREVEKQRDEGSSVAAVTWDDVAGVPHVKAQLMEVVDIFLRPERFARLGARCPQGVLLAGPPGTGKTLLAKAVASSCAVPFLCCTGSDFVEVFVGRGARRVRALFEEAAQRAPCVLFIDELDALGARRGGHGCEEHEHTLNQLLAMMDGVSGGARGILIIGATNRLAALDPALTRPGRFDRVLQLRLPDEAGRLHILKVHAARTATVGASTLLPRMAAVTPGFSGAELANLVNEASIVAVRAGKDVVDGECYEVALRELQGSRAVEDVTNIDPSLSIAALWQQLASGSRTATQGVSSVEDNE
ncbi:hypothetical protein AB1Y20_019267 [Prymnesium parvum]|uniref:AAA+ ATPase domain-containing protein n=1 Tax=Prymnesium parvum TaxID=97485 RepID=A0AB34JR80_PRYPA